MTDQTTTMKITINDWDYAFVVAFGLILLLNLIGVFKYAIKAHFLTLLIMATNLIVICCKSRRRLKVFHLSIDYTILFI